MIWRVKRVMAASAAAAVVATLGLCTVPVEAQQHGGEDSEGIKVHGHWVIEVRNPDGSLGHRAEFDNALLETGEETLAKLLTRTGTVGAWAVKLQSSNSLDVCANNGRRWCFLLEDIGQPLDVDPNYEKTLSVQIGDTDTEVVLSGSIVADYDGLIDIVQTALSSAGMAIGPDDDYVFGAFTDKFITTPISIKAQQTIYVTVTLSFS